MIFRPINRSIGIKRKNCDGVAGRQPKFRKTCIMFAGLIAAMVYVFALTGGNFQKLVIVQGLFVLSVMFLIVFGHRRLEFTAHGILILMMLALVLSSNLLVNYENFVSVDQNLVFPAVHVGGILVFALFAHCAARNLQPEYLLKSTAWMLLPLVMLALAIGLAGKEFGRAAPFGLHPNWWGELAFGFILCALTISRLEAKIVLIVVAFALMITVQSRGAMFAATVSLLAYGTMQFRPLGKSAAKKFAIFGFVILGIFLLVTMMGLWSDLRSFLLSEVLLLDHRYRGLDSGLTGRLAVWREAALVFSENPFFGHGFDTLMMVHNGFLRWASEGGILLLGVMLLLMTSAMVRSWRIRNDWAFASLLGIAAYLMSYPRALNLNLVGIVFFLALFPWKEVGNQNVVTKWVGVPKPVLQGM